MVSSAPIPESVTTHCVLHARVVSHTWQDRSGARQALFQVSLKLDSGQAHFFCGPSGAGKSTLGMILGGLISPSSGRVEFKGSDVSRQRQRIAYLFQFPEAIFFADSVRQELEHISADREDHWEHEFQRVGIRLAEIAHRHPFTLSDGFARLTALAMQMARNPDLLILDEPTIGLDWKHQERVIHALQDWLVPQKLLIIITHDLDLLEALQGTTSLLNEGRLEWQGLTGHLLKDDELLGKFALRA